MNQNSTALADNPSGLAQLVQRLQDPACFPHPVDRFQVIETHISFVLLTGPFAYKFKKPLDLGFLDFSTLEKRRFYCHEEWRLNRRLAPDLYLDVVAVGGTPDRPRILESGYGGDILDYAVRLVQFPAQAELDAVAERGALTARHIDRLADIVADFHQRTPKARLESLYGTPAMVADRMRQNFDQIAERVAGDWERERREQLLEWTLATTTGLRNDLDLRRRQGWVRECHGDLHLGNIVLLEDEPVPFDCIEFSPELRWIDTLSDTAFLLMDLHHRDLETLANRFLNRYLEATDDYMGLTVLPLYLVYRAMVRAKVAAIGAAQHRQDPAFQAAALQQCSAYLQRAETYTRPRSCTPLVITYGVSGSGKTWLSERLLEHCGAIRVRSDVERKRLLELPPDATTHGLLNEGAYRPEVTLLTYKRLQALAFGVVDAGFPVIVDATFLDRSFRQMFRRLAEVAGIPFVILACKAPEPVLRERVVQRARAGGDASEATLAVLDHQLAHQDPLDAEEQACAIEVDTAGRVDVDRISTLLRNAGGLNK